MLFVLLSRAMIKLHAGTFFLAESYFGCLNYIVPTAVAERSSTILEWQLPAESIPTHGNPHFLAGLYVEIQPKFQKKGAHTDYNHLFTYE